MTRHGKAAPRRHFWAPPDDWGAQDIQDRLPEGNLTTVPGGGMPGGVCDTSGDTGALCAPARPRHRGDFGGGQPPLTTVPPVRPPGPQAGAQWAPPGDNPVQNGGGAETSETCGGGGGGSVVEGFQSLREEAKLSKGVPIPREGFNRHGR